ncbi:MAG: P1 family peptidase [Nitriliruptorales bacterium]|nr:P1 family peptidase [Nitriliruptorales bacterium]
MALGHPEVAVGVWTSEHAPTGCTVILPPEGTLGAVAVAGWSPGTREAAALGPFGKVSECHGVVLSGGSAFGLSTADGVVRWLAEHDRGYQTKAARVPIVGGAIVLDASIAFPDHRPDADAGYAACEAASTDDPPEGAVGAGTGTKVAGVAGLEHAWRGGQGVAVRRHEDIVVGALVVNNAVGEIRAEDGTWIARARVGDDTLRYPYDTSFFEDDDADGQAPGTGPAENTVIGCLITNARLSKLEAYKVADLAGAGIARAVWPAHTYFDGDALFCLATQEVETHIDLVTAMAADVVAEACRRGPQQATSLTGLPEPYTEFPGLADQ